MPVYDVEYSATARIDADSAEDAETFVENDLKNILPDEFFIVDTREVKEEING